MTSAAAIEAQGLATLAGTRVLHRDLGLRVRRGEVLALVGGSGSGKTVLLRTLSLLQAPAAGQLTVLGEDAAGKGGGGLSLELEGDAAVLEVHALAEAGEQAGARVLPAVDGGRDAAGLAGGLGEAAEGLGPVAAPRAAVLLVDVSEVAGKALRAADDEAELGDVEMDGARLAGVPEGLFHEAREAGPVGRAAEEVEEAHSK